MRMRLVAALVALSSSTSGCGGPAATHADPPATVVAAEAARWPETTTSVGYVLIVEEVATVTGATRAFEGSVPVAIGDLTGGVVVRDSGQVPWYQVGWLAAESIVVRVDAMGLRWDAVAAIVGSLRARPPGAWSWLATVRPPVGECVDATTQVAPTLVPKGWNRFVLTAQPTGACGAFPFLMLSVTRPPEAGEERGTLVTIVTQPASSAGSPPNGAADDPATAPVELSTQGNEVSGRLVFGSGA